MARFFDSSTSLEQEPGAALSLVNPNLDQTGGSHIPVLIAHPVRRVHCRRHLPIVVAQLAELSSGVTYSACYPAPAAAARYV